MIIFTSSAQYDHNCLVILIEIVQTFGYHKSYQVGVSEKVYHKQNRVT